MLDSPVPIQITSESSGSTATSPMEIVPSCWKMHSQVVPWLELRHRPPDALAEAVDGDHRLTLDCGSQRPLPDLQDVIVPNQPKHDR